MSNMTSTRAYLMSHYLKRKTSSWSAQEQRSRDGQGSKKEGHVTPLSRTDEKIESQSNVNLQVSLI